jgi:translation initiation factor IF-3
MTMQHRVNEQIRVSYVRVVTQSAEMLGSMPTAEAIELARRARLDLVEVGSEAVTPMCRIMDYGKFAYEQKKSKSPVWPWTN